MLSTTQIMRIFRIACCIAGFVFLTGARGACFYTGPDLVVMETSYPAHTTHPPVAEETVIVEETYYEDDGAVTTMVTETSTVFPTYFGDLQITYDFGGFSCADMDVYTWDMAIYDWAGHPVIVEFGLPCDIYSQILVPELEMGPYTITLIGRDPWGFDTLTAYIAFDHEYWFTPLHLSL